MKNAAQNVKRGNREREIGGMECKGRRLIQTSVKPRVALFGETSIGQVLRELGTVVSDGGGATQRQAQ